jgi:hypothetical protein
MQQVKTQKSAQLSQPWKTQTEFPVQSITHVSNYLLTQKPLEILETRKSEYKFNVKRKAINSKNSRHSCSKTAKLFHKQEKQ